MSHSWFAAQDLPQSIRCILQTSPVFAEVRLRKAVFEKQTQLDDLGRGPSQTDVLAIVEIRSGVAVVGVEGKVNESFGQLIRDWNDYSPSKLRRLATLVESLALKSSKSIGFLRYQLLHQTVAAVLEGKKEGAAEAVMLVQSFSPEDTKTGFSDFQAFATALGAPVEIPGRLSEPIELREIRLRLGWTIDQMRAC